MNCAWPIRSVLALGSALILTWPSESDADAIEADQLRRSAEAVLSRMPGPIQSRGRCIVDAVARTVRPESYGDVQVGGANMGVAALNAQRLTTMPCFATLASDFTSGLEDQDQQNPVTRHNGGRRPRIQDQAGEGEHRHLVPGGILARARNLAGGDGELAAAILGVCGTDDVFQLPTIPPIQLTQSRRLTPTEGLHAQQLVSNIRQSLTAARDRLSGASDGSGNPEAVRAEIDRLNHLLRVAEQQVADHRDNRPSATRILRCPGMNSGLYVPGGLGPTATLSQATRNRVVNAQDPQATSTGASRLPAKGYHFNGGLMTGCSVASCGVPNAQVGQIAGLLSGLYRAHRICSEARAADESTRRFAAQLASVDSATQAVLAASRDLSANELPPDLGRIASRLFVARRLNNPLPSPEIIRQQVASALGRIDATRLFRSFYLGGQHINGIPCTPIQVGGPGTVGGAIDRLRGRRCGDLGLSEERCNEALKRLETFAADLQWTGEQHQRGAEIGAELCSGRSNPNGPLQDAGENSLEARACRALGQTTQEPRATAPETGPRETQQ